MQTPLQQSQQLELIDRAIDIGTWALFGLSCVIVIINPEVLDLMIESIMVVFHKLLGYVDQASVFYLRQRGAVFTAEENAVTKEN